MPIEHWLTFVAASAILHIIPGLTILTVISYSVAHGRRVNVLLAATFITLATLNASLYTVFAGSARKLLASPRTQHRFHIAGGSLLSTAGVWALLARRAA